MRRKESIGAWIIKGEVVELTYTGGECVKVSKKDFDRAFGTILSASKEEVIRDFAL